MTQSAPLRLTHRQLRFVEEYLVDGNATKAAVRAGYSRRTARQTGSEKLSKPVIQNELELRIEDSSNGRKQVANELLTQAYCLLLADLADIFDCRGVPLPVKAMPIAFRQGLLASMKVRHEVTDGRSTVTIFTLKFADRLKLLRMLGDRLGVWSIRRRSGVPPSSDRKWSSGAAGSSQVADAPPDLPVERKDWRRV
jgi:phage terminase small subunit